MLATAAILPAYSMNIMAQETAAPQRQKYKELTFPKTVHDFGEVSWKDGALKCSFTLTNNSRDTLDIYAAISSCGCTDVEWTRTPIAPGGKGTVSATYANEDGAYPFDKTVTVYTSAQKKPFVLHLKGVVK